MFVQGVLNSVGTHPCPSHLSWIPHVVSTQTQTDHLVDRLLPVLITPLQWLTSFSSLTLIWIFHSLSTTIPKPTVCSFPHCNWTSRSLYPSPPFPFPPLPRLHRLLLQMVLELSQQIVQWSNTKKHTHTQHTHQIQKCESTTETSPLQRGAHSGPP